ncbi:MAG TPA: RluA family pseudouridine synthase [Kofleriaceae bacterium]|nr:RluA family pseudouridine synthase [Kofleriaceae bacterium]
MGPDPPSRVVDEPGLHGAGGAGEAGGEGAEGAGEGEGEAGAELEGEPEPEGEAEPEAEVDAQLDGDAEAEPEPDDELDDAPAAELRAFDVDVDDRPRLDAFVAERDPALSRAQVQRLIDLGQVRVNGAPAAKAGQRLRAGDRIEVAIPAPVPIDLVPEPMPLAILFEDAHLIVVDKPAGLVVHPAPGHPRGTLVHGLLAHVRDLAGIGGELRPGIVHRLDKDTSGVMVVAKDEPTLVGLQRAFKAKTDLVREYVAVCAPAPPGARGTIRTLHDRHPVDRKRFSSKVSRGKPAVTHWEVVERFAVDAAVVRCRLETGRTHQIRVHLADQGWPLVGDPLYGRRYTGKQAALAPLAAALGRQALHAARLDFVHPSTGAPLRFATDPPADLQALIEALRALPRR